VGMMGHGIEGSDTSAAPWYFQAPPDILGDRSAAYGGLLRINYGHRCNSPSRSLVPRRLRWRAGHSTPTGRRRWTAARPASATTCSSYRATCAATSPPPTCSTGAQWAATMAA
jgi:hypothetical protein